MGRKNWDAKIRRSRRNVGGRFALLYASKVSIFSTLVSFCVSWKKSLLVQGIEGDHVRIQPLSNPIQLIINPHFDESIRELANRIVPVCSDYHSVAQHVESVCESKRSGVVSQAFAAACRTILEEYHLYVAQLESCQVGEGLSLQKMWYHIQPLQHTLKVLAEATRLIKEVRFLLDLR